MGLPINIRVTYLTGVTNQIKGYQSTKGLPIGKRVTNKKKGYLLLKGLPITPRSGMCPLRFHRLVPLRPAAMHAIFMRNSCF